MNKLIRQIKEFNKKFQTHDPSDPTLDIDPNYKSLRIMLMKEELEELIEGMKNNDLENVAKELADVLYVLIGTASSYGLLNKFEEIFDEVHKSNMSKTYVEGKGKPVKSNDFQEADIAKILKTKP